MDGICNAPSPLAGEGCEGLVSVSEPSRSWMGGSVPTGAQRESAHSRLLMRNCTMSVCYVVLRSPVRAHGI
jgi:hypothetical protein